MDRAHPVRFRTPVNGRPGPAGAGDLAWMSTGILNASARQHVAICVALVVSKDGRENEVVFRRGTVRGVPFEPAGRKLESRRSIVLPTVVRAEKARS